MISMRRVQALTVVATFSMLPNLAMACAVCGAQEEKAAGAYLAMTIFLSLLPLSLIGGTGYWLWRRAKHVPPCEPPKPQANWKDLMLSTPTTDSISLPQPDTSPST